MFNFRDKETDLIQQDTLEQSGEKEIEAIERKRNQRKKIH
jgi:hypothetical protein